MIYQAVLIYISALALDLTSTHYFYRFESREKFAERNRVFDRIAKTRGFASAIIVQLTVEVAALSGLATLVSVLSGAAFPISIEKAFVGWVSLILVIGAIHHSTAALSNRSIRRWIR